MDKKTFHHGDLKAALLNESVMLIEIEGYQDFSIRKVAKRCGVSQTAIYRHYKNKDELLGAVILLLSNKIALDLGTEVVPDHGLDTLLSMGTTFVSYMVAHPKYLELIFLSPFGYANISPEVQPSLFLLFQKIVYAIEPNSFLVIQLWCFIIGLLTLLYKKNIVFDTIEDQDVWIHNTLQITMHQFIKKEST